MLVVVIESIMTERYYEATGLLLIVENTVTELFGNRDDFAIEAGVEPHLNPPSAVWGHLCIWCRGIAIGDIENKHCGLYDVYTALLRVKSSIHQLWAEGFNGMSDEAIWNHLDGLLFGYHGVVEMKDDRTVEQCQRDSMAWGQFSFLTNWGELFNGHKGFILHPPGNSIRLFIRDRHARTYQRFEVSQRGFESAVEGFLRWFEAQESRLREVGR